MEALKAQINHLKKQNQALSQLQKASGGGTKPMKYFRKGDKEKAEYEQRLKEEEEKKNESLKRIREVPNGSVRIIKKQKKENSLSDITMDLPKLEISRRFRIMGEPIKLFGETEEERRKRLNQVQQQKGSLLFGEDGDQETGSYVSNTLIRKHRELLFEKDTPLNEIVEEEEYIEQFYIPILSDDQVLTPTQKETDEEGTSKEPKEEETQAGKECDLISEYFSNALDSWRQEFSQMTPEMKQLPINRKKILTYKDCQDNLILFFKICKHRGLPNDVRGHLLNIVKFCKEKNYREAYQSYLQITVGTSAWSIGVNGIGIHERASRELLQSKNIQHLMNNEEYRMMFANILALMYHIQEKDPSLPSRSM